MSTNRECANEAGEPQAVYRWLRPLKAIINRVVMLLHVMGLPYHEVLLFDKLSRMVPVLLFILAFEF